jgi:chaperonin GroES
VAKSKSKKTASKPVKKAPAKKAAPKKVTKKVAKKVAKKAETKVSAKKPTPVKATQSKPAAAKTLSKNLSHFITPLDDRLMVRTVSAEKKTPGGLFIPDTVSSVEGHLEGIIVAVGRGHRDTKGRLRPMDVKVGDSILFNSYVGNKIDVQGETLTILRETEIFGIRST